MSSPKVGETWTLSLLLVSAVILSGFSYPVVATFCNTFLFSGSCNPLESGPVQVFGSRGINISEAEPV